ncbi:MAG: DnaD domain protein [Eubacteriales bacterium]|nr:DnaD domain protein [Eubacteriales bacterium]
MNKISLICDGRADATILSNIFIDEYMKDANDAQLKVYLYLVRMLQAQSSVSISDIADKFNHTEKDVLRALRYWEKCRVLTLEYASDKSLAGIRLLNLNQESPVRTDKSPIPATVSVVSHQTISSLSSFEKPAYTLDDLKAFGQQESAAQLFFIAEQYLGRTLSPADMKSILFFKDRLHFSDDLIDYLLQYCVERGKKDFRYIEKVAIGWAESGVTTPAEAERQSSRYDKNVYSIMNALGKTSAPAKSEIAYIKRWTAEYGFELEVILEACNRTVLATDKHRFAYADSILSAWFKAGVHHVSDISGLDISHQKEKTVKPARSGSAAEYNRFMHSKYDFDALEKELLK